MAVAVTEGVTRAYLSSIHTARRQPGLPARLHAGSTTLHLPPSPTPRRLGRPWLAASWPSPPPSCATRSSRSARRIRGASTRSSCRGGPHRQICRSSPILSVLSPSPSPSPSPAPARPRPPRTRVRAVRLIGALVLAPAPARLFGSALGSGSALALTLAPAVAVAVSGSGSGPGSPAAAPHNSGRPTGQILLDDHHPRAAGGGRSRAGDDVALLRAPCAAAPSLAASISSAKQRRPQVISPSSAARVGRIWRRTTASGRSSGSAQLLRVLPHGRVAAPRRTSPAARSTSTSHTSPSFCRAHARSSVLAF